MRIVFCNIGYMKYYKGEEELPINGGEYIKRHGFGHEMYNFDVVNGICYGMVCMNGKNVDYSQ